MRRFRPFCRLCLLYVLLAALLLGASCGRPLPPPPAAAVLSVMLSAMGETAQTLPDGILRLTAASPDSPDRLTEVFLSALYGEAVRGMLGEDTAQSPPVTDAALFLSLSPYPCELGVFRCADGDTAREMAGLCRGRLDTLARGFAGSEWEHVAAEGQVAMEGNWVLLILCEDPQAVREAAGRTVKGT